VRYEEFTRGPNTTNLIEFGHLEYVKRDVAFLQCVAIQCFNFFSRHIKINNGFNAIQIFPILSQCLQIFHYGSQCVSMFCIITWYKCHKCNWNYVNVVKSVSNRVRYFQWNVFILNTGYDLLTNTLALGRCQLFEG
jgi:hypothetical protein